MKDRISGNIACINCLTREDIIWYTDNVFWNEVMGKNERNKILCVYCFTKRAEKKFKIMGWRLLPDWKWVKSDEDE